MTIPHGLPQGYTLEVADNKIFIKNNERYIVTKQKGYQLKAFIRCDLNEPMEKAFQAARTFAWSYYDGNEKEYELEVTE